MSSQDIYQKQVELALTNLGKKPQNILVFYGRSGIGKKDLCDSIFESWKSQCLCALLDGEEIGEDFWNALKTAVIQLRKHFSPAKDNFTCFDLAYFSYMKRVESNLPANSAEFSKRMGYAEIGDNATELINGFLEEFKKLPIPGIEPLAKLAWFCMLLSNPEHWEWYRRSKCRDRLQEVGNCTRNKEVLQQLPIFLLNDLHESLQSSNLPAFKRKAMILVDGYEYLLDKSLRCTWLEEMVTQRNPNVLWVIFSEQPLNLTQNTHNIPIIPLTDDECQAVLKEKFGIDDPQIRQIIIQASGGIPLYLQLGVETWQDIKKQRQPKVADFTRNLNEVLRQRDAAWEPDEQRMWQVLSNCRTWDKALFVSLIEQFQLENWRDLFDKVLASPYVEQAGSGWRLHPIMRQHLQENQPEELKRAVNSWLFEHYQREYQNPEIQLTALREALHHGLESQQPQQAISWFLEQVAVQQNLGRYQAVAPMLQFLLKGKQNIHATTALARTLLGKSLVALGDYDRAVEDLEIARSQWIALQQGDSLDGATVELELAGVYLKLERTFDASNAVQKALRIRTTQLGANELGVAEVLNHQAEVAASQGDYREAANLSQRALQILQSDPNTQPLQLAQWKYTAAWLNAYNNNLDVAEKLCQEAMEIAKNVASDEHPLAISCQAFLGDIYQGMGQHKYQKAYEQYQLALDAAEISFGPSHPQTLQLLQALTHLCRKVGEYDTADEFAERHNTHVQLGNFEETAGAALRLNNLGISLLNKGQYGKAEPLLKQALQIGLKVLGAEHPDTASSLNNLAGLYKSQGRYDEAEPLYNQALQINLKVLGAEHPDTASSLNNLAGLYDSQGRYDEAEPLYNQALQINLKVLRAEHPDTASSLNNLAGLYDSQGRYDEAEPLYNQALQIRLKVLGAEHPDTASSLNNLAGLYKSQGRYDEAEPLYNQALQINLKVLGAEHPDTASSLNNLAALYDSQGRYDEAEPLYNQALQIRLKVLGAEHPDTARSLNNLAGLYKSQGRYDEAEPLYNQALQINLKVLGAEHPDTARSLNNLAALYDSQGRYDEAEPLYNQALQINLKVLGAEHPDTARSLNNLAALYDSQGRYDEAEPLLKQALQINLKVLRAEHPDTARSLNNLAWLYDFQGRYNEAEPLYNQALQINLKVLGAEHPDTKAVESNLILLRKQLLS